MIFSALFGNTWTTILYGSLGDNVRSTAGVSPTAVSLALNGGKNVTYGRRTSTIISLNLAGKTGPARVAVGGRATIVGRGSALLDKILGGRLNIYERLTVDTVLAVAEAAYCKWYVK
jgi:hypothetical protein